MAEGVSSELQRGDGATTLAVLIVDDDPFCRGYCARILKARGYRVTEARNAGEGLRALQAASAVLVLCDLRLPDPVLQSRLFANCQGTGGSIPALLLMSAGEAASRRGPGAPPPGTPLLRKPFGAEALLDAAEAALRRAGRAAPAQAGVRDEPRPRSDRLAAPFRAAMSGELGRLDREIIEGRWEAARDTLHRLRGAAAMCGFATFAEACRRLVESSGNGKPDWTVRYLELLRSGEDVLDRS